ncbi:MAG: site-specific integrase [Clostridiaceae bacterium]
MIDRKQSLQEFVAAFADELRRMQYPVTNISVLTSKCHELETYALSQGIMEYCVELGQKFLSTWYPVAGKFKTYADVDMHTKNAYWTVGLLNDYLLHGVFTTMRKTRVTPLSDEHERILFEYHKYQLEHGYADQSAKRCRYSMRTFLLYLSSNKVEVSDISEPNIIGFLSAYIDKSKSYIETQIIALKRFAAYASDTGLTSTDISKYIPPLARVASQRIPSVWEDCDIDKLLSSVDRGSPLGKRDYAILLLAAKLGLRRSDIKGLEFKDINWEDKRIDIVQRKTQKPLSLPLPDDVGWAIIDYLKYGRPKSEFPQIFLRHVTPIAPFSDSSALGCIISRYRTIAGIDIGDNVRKGMHSLRHTFATRLLREKVPLETIAELLGHVGMRSVDIYLNVETEALRCCALNPDEVFNYD